MHKLTSLIIGNLEDENIIFNTARALASRDRINILRLLVDAPMNIYEISKRLNIPISTVSNHISVLNDIMKELLDGKTAYCLRHTFATTCQQYVRPDIVDIWMGDSPTRLVGRVYTHFPDKFMREQMDLVMLTTI